MNGDLLARMREEFDLTESEPALVAPLILAHLGDAVYEVVTRVIVASKGNRPINSVHRDNVRMVSATTQAKMADILEEHLSEDELNQYKRGRNAKSATSAKNASLHDYRKATGFEALIGYLFLCGKDDRILELCKLGFEKLKL